MLLSDAIHRGNLLAPTGSTAHYLTLHEEGLISSDPLGAAYLGSLRTDALSSFLAAIRVASHDNFCRTLMRGLHHVFPHLGMSVRYFPRLAAQLVAESILPNDPRRCKRENHMSLWQAVMELYEERQYSKDRVAVTLATYGL